MIGLTCNKHSCILNQQGEIYETAKIRKRITKSRSKWNNSMSSFEMEAKKVVKNTWNYYWDRKVPWGCVWIRSEEDEQHEDLVSS